MISFDKKNIISTVLCLLLLIPTYVLAKDSAIVIFDGSGSMKAKVGGKSKISIAREVMGSLVQDWNEDIDLGLMVYGHRSKACDDIEMVVPVGKPDPATLLDAINRIKPKGETPIGASLKKAAEQLNYIESPTTVILISDGEESCKSDPCAIAKELEKSGVNFTAHVIGFDVSDKKKAKALEQLKCVAESTGGKFFEANNPEGLKEALAETAKAVAVAKPMPTPEPAPVSQVTGVKLSAVATEGSEPFSKFNDVTYYVYEAKKDLDGKRKNVTQSSEAFPLIKLAAGKYVVAVKRGNIRVEAEIEIKAGELVEHQFVLNAGNLRLSAVPVEGADPFSKMHDVQYFVYEAKKDLDGKRKKIYDSLHVSPVFKLAAGQYVIGAKRGNIWVEAEIEVKAGELVEHRFVLNAGNLRLSAVPVEGADPISKRDDVAYYVYESKKDMDGKRKVVNSSTIYASPLFKLAAGQYVVGAARGNSSVEAKIVVKAGELVEHSFVLNTGNLKLSAVLVEGADPISKRDDIAYYVYEPKKDMEGKRKVVNSSTIYASPSFKLAAGHYVVGAKRGDVWVEAPIEVKAGELVEHTFVMSSSSSDAGK